MKKSKKIYYLVIDGADSHISLEKPICNYFDEYSSFKKAKAALIKYFSQQILGIHSTLRYYRNSLALSRKLEES